MAVTLILCVFKLRITKIYYNNNKKWLYEQNTVYSISVNTNRSLGTNNRTKNIIITFCTIK